MWLVGKERALVKTMESSPSKLQFFLASLVIIFCVTAQGAALTGHRLFFSTTFPFIFYPMYSSAHYEGEEVVDREMIFAIVKDSTAVQIVPEDLGLDFWDFQLFLKAIDQQSNEVISQYLEIYQSRAGKQVLQLQIKVHPWTLSRKGFIQGEQRVRKILERIPHTNNWQIANLPQT